MKKDVFLLITKETKQPTYIEVYRTRKGAFKELMALYMDAVNNNNFYDPMEEQSWDYCFAVYGYIELINFDDAGIIMRLSIERKVVNL